MLCRTAANPYACTQVKVAEHIVTNHKVAIKILNKRKIKQLDMEEKGMWGHAHMQGTYIATTSPKRQHSEEGD